MTQTKRYTVEEIDQLVIDRLADPALVADILMDIMTSKSKSLKFNNLGVGSGNGRTKAATTSSQ